MQSRNRFVIAGVALALVMLVAQAATAQSRNRPERNRAEQPGWLGVSIQDVTGDIKEALPRGVTDGAIVNSVVEDSPAAKTGLKEGDIITHFDGTAIHDADDLTAAVRDAGSGKLADIEYYRDGRRLRERVTLGEPAMSSVRRPNRNALNWVQKDDGEEGEEGEEAENDSHTWMFDNGHGPMEFLFQGDRPARLGVRLTDLGDQLAAYFKVGGDGGVLVTEVVEGSAAAKAGMLAGDVIVAVGDQSVSDAAELEKQESRDRRFGMRAPRMERFHFDAEPDMRAFPAPPRMGVDRNELKDQMKELRDELKQLRKELTEMRKARP